jgi:ABC-type cobalt transport system substrate-binding protein
MITERIVLLSLLVALCLCVSNSPAFCEETGKWPGVDESVVEKYAKEYGRAASEPFINTDQGDLLLFLFLLAGTVGGFAAGYYWRVLLTTKSPCISKAEQPQISSRIYSGGHK